MGYPKVGQRRRVEHHRPQPVKVAAKKAQAEQKPEQAANANAKRADANLYGGQMRSRILKKETERNNFLGAVIAGTNGAARTPTSTAEKFGYAPRTKESATAARTVSGTIDRQIESGNMSRRFWKTDSRTMGVGVHKDGSITVSGSGNGGNAGKFYDNLNKPGVRDAIQQDLNRAFEGNSNIKRSVNGDVEWRTGLNQTNIDLSTATMRRNGEIVPSLANSNTCAAGKFYQNGAGKDNPIVAADEIWRGRENVRTDADGRTVGDRSSNPHPDKIKINNADALSMSPCEGCQTNSDKLTNGRVQPEGMTLRSTARTGITGGLVGGATETLTQLWDNGFDVRKLDGGKIAREAGLGAVSDVAGEFVERGSSRVVSNLAEKAINFGLNRGFINSADDVGKNLAQRVLSRAIPSLTTSDPRLISSNVGKFVGAGVSGGVIGGGIETVRQWGNLQDDTKAADAVGSIAAQAAVGVAAGVAGAQIGAMIGTAIPIPGVGTVAGAAIGFAVGYGVSKLGIDKAIASGVSKFASATGLDHAAASATRGISNAASAVGDAASSAFSGAASKLSSIFG